MPIPDNLAVRIRAVEGQTAITDDIAGLVVDTGTGTVTQMEDATYGRFWRLTGGAKSAVLAGMGEWMNGNATTMAMRFRVSNRAENYSRFVIMGSDSDSGLMIGNAGTSTGGLRVGVQVIGSNIGSVGPAAYTAGTMLTAVLRFTEGATDAYDAWYNTVDRVGTDPNSTATSTTTSSYRGRALLQFLTAAENLDIFDYDLWLRGLTNAEAAAVADDIRGQLYPATGDATATGATLTGTSSFSPGSATGQASATAAGATLTGTADLTPGAASSSASASAAGATLTGTSDLTPGSAVASASGSFTSDVATNNTGSDISSVAVLWQWSQGAGIGVAPTSVTYGTGTTNAYGQLTVTGLPPGAGELMYATADYLNVYYQRGTVT